MPKHLLSHDYPCFAIKSSRSEIIALRRVSQGRGNRVLSSLILDPNSRGLKQLYRDHPDHGGEVDHAAPIARLAGYDGWALSTSAEALPAVLALCPAGGPGRCLAPWRAAHPEPVAAACVGAGHLLRRPPADQRYSPR